jgi:hypothetical protein
MKQYYQSKAALYYQAFSIHYASLNDPERTAYSKELCLEHCCFLQTRASEFYALARSL